MTPVSTGKLLTTAEAGKLAAPPVSSDTVLREIHAGRLEATEAGGRWLVAPDEARRWAAGYRRGAHTRNPRGRQLAAAQTPAAFRLGN